MVPVRRRWSALRAGQVAVLALFVVLRIPSLFEPEWYTDEAGYTVVGRSLLHGAVLYRDVWNNKPPIHLWLIAIVTGIGGDDEFPLHVLTLITGAIVVVTVGHFGARWFSVWRGLLAGTLIAVALGLPVFDAELAVPESILIAPVALALCLLIDSLRGGETPTVRRQVVIGVLLGVAFGIQQTALASIAAALLLVLCVNGWRPFARIAAVIAALTAAWLIPALITAGPSNVAFALVGFYVAYTQSVIPGNPVVHLLDVGLAVAAVIAGTFLARRRPGAAWMVWCWAAAELAVAATAHQVYAHFLIPSLAAGALGIASLPTDSTSARRLATSARAVVGGKHRDLVSAGKALLALGVVGIWIGASVVKPDWIPNSGGVISGDQTVGAYYGKFITGGSLADWRAWFDGRVTADRAVADWIHDNGYAGARAVVWSSDSWLYALADLPLLMPTPPIYNDEVLLGNGGPVAARVDALRPQVIITSNDAVQEFPEITDTLKAHYRVAFSRGPDVIWVRTTTVAVAPIGRGLSASVNAPGRVGGVG